MFNNGFYQTFFVEWFDQVLIGAHQFSTRPIKQCVLTGQHNDRSISEIRVAFDQSASLKSIQTRHHHIYEYNVGAGICYFGQTIKPIFGKHNLTARLGQKYLTATPDSNAVVDQRYFHTGQ